MLLLRSKANCRLQTTDSSSMFHKNSNVVTTTDVYESVVVCLRNKLTVKIRLCTRFFPDGPFFCNRRQESMYAMTGLYAESGCTEGAGDSAPGPSTPPHPSHPPRESIKCHSRNPSAGICDR